MMKCILATFVTLSTLFVASRSSIAEDRAKPGDPDEVVAFTAKDIQQYYESHHEEVARRDRQFWVKAIIVPTAEQAQEAKQRAMTGEDFDDLIAEYFVPYFAKHRNDRYITKEVDFGWVNPKDFWHGALANLMPGQVAGPYPSFGKSPECVVFKVISERPAETVPVEALSDNIYSRLWDTLADTRMVSEVDVGRNWWCGTCRGGHNVNGQLAHLGRQYSAGGDEPKAISACLLALREDSASSNRNGPTPNEDGLNPEEQFLVGRGMDLLRYYRGVFDRVERGQVVSLPDSLPWRVAQMQRDAVIPMLMRLVENRGRWSTAAMYALGTMKAQEAIPVLRTCLDDRQLRIVELGWGDKKAVYAHYVLREAARNALTQMGAAPGDVKIIVGAVQGDELPSDRR